MCTPTGVMWDADRSQLMRVGMVPDPAYFSVAPQHNLFEDMIAQGHHVLDNTPSWDELIQKVS